MADEPARIHGTARFGGDFELDSRAYQLRRAGRPLKLERIPMEVLFLLVQRKGQLVTREEIVARIWGREVYLDTDNSINGAVRKLRQALRDNPENPHVIQTVTGKGYRFIAEVDDPGVDHFSPTSSLVSPLGPEEKPETNRELARPGTRSPRWPVLAGFALVLIAALTIYLQRSGPRPGRAGGRLMLAVLPFENLTGDPAQDYFSDGLTEEMISRLGNLEPRRLAVIARTSVMHYKNSAAPIDQIARELHVDYVLEGSVRREANRVRISAQLIQISDGTHLWARQYNRELNSLLAVQEEIAQAVANQIDLTLDSSHQNDARPTALSDEALEAYDLYLQGRYFWSKRSAEGFEAAVVHFRRAVETDPTYARAYAGLADSYALMSTYGFGVPEELIPKARSAALRALELDDRLAEAHTSLALIEESYDWDWKSAEKEYRRGIQLNPNYATAHQWYAELLSFQGRFGKAFEESERARQLDPMSLSIATDHAAIQYYARQYDRAIQEFRAVLQRDPTFHRPHMVVWAYAEKGMFAEALAEIDDWRRLYDEPWSWAAQVYVYGHLSRYDEARAVLAKLEQSARKRPSDPPPMLPIAYLGMNEKEKALTGLERCLADRSSVIMTLKVEPLYDPIREDPRFQELLRRAGLAR